MVEPAHLADAAREIAELHTRTVGCVQLLSGAALRLSFSDGRALLVQPQNLYESWSYVGTDGGRVICMPGGGLAVWAATDRPD